MINTSTAGAIPAIPTRYKGYHFRSRLEARWAVYFDAIGCAWDYEPQGFVLRDGTPYLPDFWLSTVYMWAEVKPCWPTEAEVNKAIQLSDATDKAVLFLDGVPRDVNYWAVTPISWDQDRWSDYLLDSDYLDENRFYGCTGLDFGESRKDQTLCSRDGAIAAVNAALSARFEHGESGRT